MTRPLQRFAPTLDSLPVHPEVYFIDKPFIKGSDGSVVWPSTELFEAQKHSVTGEHRVKSPGGIEIIYSNRQAGLPQGMGEADLKATGLADWRELTSFKMNRPGIEKVVGFDIRGQEDQNHIAILYPERELSLSNSSGWTDAQFGEVVLDRPPFSVDGIFRLFQGIAGIEIMRGFNNQNSKVLQMLQDNYSSGEVNTVETMRRIEEAAWEAARRALEPLLSDDPDDELSAARLNNTIKRDGHNPYSGSLLRNRASRALTWLVLKLLG